MVQPRGHSGASGCRRRGFQERMEKICARRRKEKDGKHPRHGSKAEQVRDFLISTECKSLTDTQQRGSIWTPSEVKSWRISQLCNLRLSIESLCTGSLFKKLLFPMAYQQMLSVCVWVLDRHDITDCRPLTSVRSQQLGSNSCWNLLLDPNSRKTRKTERGRGSSIYFIAALGRRQQSTQRMCAFVTMSHNAHGGFLH